MWGAGSEWTGKRGAGKGKNKNDQEAGSEAVSDRASNWTTQRSVSVQSTDGSKAKFRRESKTIQTPGR